MDFILYTDGGARGNPGPSGVGVAITDGEGNVVTTKHQGLGIGTNNEAEYKAVKLGVQTLKDCLGDEAPQKNLELRLDSELVAKQLLGLYKVKEERLKILNNEVKSLIQAYFPKLKITHVRREQNKLADELANTAMDEQENRDNG